MGSQLSLPSVSQEHLHLLIRVCSANFSDSPQTFFSSPFSVKLLAVTWGCHVCLVKGSYDKWQQLYKLISL